MVDVSLTSGTISVSMKVDSETRFYIDTAGRHIVAKTIDSLSSGDSEPRRVGGLTLFSNAYGRLKSELKSVFMSDSAVLFVRGNKSKDGHIDEFQLFDVNRFDMVHMRESTAVGTSDDVYSLGRLSGLESVFVRYLSQVNPESRVSHLPNQKIEHLSLGC